MLLAALLTALPGHAEPKPLSIRSLAVLDDTLPKWHVATADGRYEPLNWSAKQASPPIHTQADGQLILFAKETDKEGQTEYKEARKVQLPEAADEVLLLGWPVDNDEKAELLALADDISHAKFNDWLLINRSGQRVSLRYGSDNETVEVGPGESKSIQIKAEPGKGGELIAQVEHNGEMRTMYSTYWAAQEKQRSLVLFYTKDSRVRLQRIIDFLPVAEARQP